MSIYIYKNRQQLGPFEEEMVLIMLKNGQLSLSDLAVRHGESQWQPLEILFPQPKQADNFSNLPNYNQTQSSSQKSGSSTMWLLGLLGVGGLGLLGIIGLVGFFIYYSSKSVNSASAANKQKTNVESNSNSSNSPTNIDEAKIKDLQNKAEEFVKMSPPQQISINPTIKGKVTIVEKDGFDAKIIGFDYTGKEYSTDIDQYGIAKVRLATRPEEIDTLVQISCSKGKFIAKYEGGVSGFANNCKVSIIDKKTPAVIAQGTFTNSTPPKSISSVYESGGEFVFPKPHEVEEYISSFPLDKLANPTANIPSDNDKGTYGKYKPFKDLASEFSKVVYPVSLDPNAMIKGKIAVALKEATGRTDLKGFDVYGKEFYSYDYESWGITKDKMAEKPEEIDTLIKINCKKGNRLSSVRKTTIYSNQCEVSIIDYKTSTTVSQQTFENKKNETDIDTEVYPTQYIVINPSAEINEFIKGFPKS